MSPVAHRAFAAGCRRFWVLTTDDNVDALRFYQRRGFRLTAVRCGRSTRHAAPLKPQIPVIGNYGIPIREEIELAQDLPLSPGHLTAVSTIRFCRKLGRAFRGTLRR